MSKKLIYRLYDACNCMLGQIPLINDMQYAIQLVLLYLHVI